MAHRDYLKEASSVIFKDSVSLSDLAESDHHQVVANLLRVIYEARNPMQAMLRKAAAYGLGQIGDPKAMKQLRAAYDAESADGVRDAMRASMTAIKLAPMPQYSQAERCQII
jgi:HEAT repeat protein